MQYLIFSILFSTLNHLLFKTFAKYKITLLPVIAINYLICTIIGLSIGSFSFQETLSQNWLPFSALQGVLLISSFFLMGLTTRNHGVAITSLSSRISVAIPTTAAFFLYNDTLTFTKLSGLILAILALILSSNKNTVDSSKHKTFMLLPILLFFSYISYSYFLVIFNC